MLSRKPGSVIRRCVLLGGTAGVVFSAVLSSAQTGPATRSPFERQLAAVKAVGPEGHGHVEAMAAWTALAAAKMDQLPLLLAGMDDAGELAENWLRAAVETVVQRRGQQGERLPLDVLLAFLSDTRHGPRARRLAFELVLNEAPQRARSLVPGFLNDPSLELRRDAVQWQMDQGAKLLKQDNRRGAVSSYRKALTAARDVDQIRKVSRQLVELGQKVKLAEHFGFVVRWQLCGPLDNREGRGFDLAYEPESRVDLAARYEGLSGPVGWIEHSTANDYGVVDLTKALDKHKGAICYASCEFVSDRSREVELRFGTPNGNKLFLNGQLLSTNTYYHENMQIDQYRATGQLRKGVNMILLKIAQNEQSEDWAQRWQFQLRVCDQYGTAILASNRYANAGEGGTR